MKMPIINLSDSKQKISSRQVSAERRNLIIVCRYAIKTLIDKAVLTALHDEDSEVANFMTIVETILNHRIKHKIKFTMLCGMNCIVLTWTSDNAHFERSFRKAHRSWYVIEEPGSFWSYIQAACASVPRSCIDGIADNVKPAIAKGRAWLRCVLMEKRLSEYLTTAVHNTTLTRNYYLDGAIMLSEDVSILFEEFLGLNAIDFRFCLNGDDPDLSIPLVVDYSPYLKFQQSRESLIHDEEELRALSMKSSTDGRVCTGMTDEELGYVQKYRLLDEKYRNACEQKGYLEELLRQRENQLDAVQQQNQDLVYTIRQLEKEKRKDRKELEGVIIELQEQLSSMKMKYANLQESFTYLQDYPFPISKQDQENVIPMEDLGSIGSRSLSPAMVKQMDCDQQSLSSLEYSLLPLTSTSTDTSHHRCREVVQSMIPLTGSLTSQQSRMLFTEPLTQQQSIKILTESHVSEENGQYTEYISFGPAFTNDIGVIAPMEYAGFDIITPSEYAGIDDMTSFEDADTIVIIPFEDADREKEDSLSGPSMPPERPNQSKGLGFELCRDYLLDSVVEQRDKQTYTDKIVCSRDPDFISDDFPPAAEESFFVVYENSEAVRNQYRPTVEHSSHDSGVIYSGELNLESYRSQGLITLQSFANIDINNSAKVETSEMLLSDSFEEIEQSEILGKLEERSESDTSTLDDTEFVLLDVDAGLDSDVDDYI